MGAARAGVGQAECALATLGSFALQVRERSVPSPSTQKARALLAYLILHRKTDVSRERLVEIFWPDADPQRARDSLNTAMHSIRRGLRAADLDADEYIFANKSVVRWNADVDLDVERLERANEESNEENVVRDALARYRGEFLEGDYDDWTVAERERISANYERLLAQTVRTTKEPEIAKRLIARNPYDEDAYAALIDAELAAGRYLSGAEIVAQCTSALKEIGVTPSASFIERYGDIGRTSTAGSGTLELPFVGRDAEFAEIAGIIEGARTIGPQIAVIAGEPGIGKSALVERLSNYALARGLRVVSVRAASDDTRAFGAWPALYESLSKNAFAQLAQAAQGTLTAELANAILACIPERSIIVLDDAQYLSGDAFETFVVLAKAVAAEGSHVIVACTRPEGLNSIVTRLAETPLVVTNLFALTDSQMEAAMALASIDLDVEMKQRLCVRARGHPLYLKGLLNQLVRSGALRREGRRWQLLRGESDVQFPASLRKLIESRIRARGAQAVVVAAALALEPPASAAEIADAVDLDQTAVLDALDDLLGYSIVTEPPSGPRQFAFSHDLLEETARNLLPAARRVWLHNQFAQVLARSTTRDRDIRRARHLESGGQFEEAARAYAAAARESVEWHAPHAALERCDAALDCLDRVVDSEQTHVLRSQVHEMRSNAYRVQWQLDDCVLAARKAVECARASTDQRRLADALLALRSSLLISEDPNDEGLLVVREVAIIGERLADKGLIAQALIDEAHRRRLARDYDRAMPCAQRGFAAARESGQDLLVVKAALQIIALQTAWWTFKNVDETCSILRAGMARVSPFDRIHAHFMLALLGIELERYADAELELAAVQSWLDDPASKQKVLTPGLARPETAIRYDYFQASLNARRGEWDTGLERFTRYATLYQRLLDVPRYRDLFAFAKIDLLLGRGLPEDHDLASELLSGAAPDWYGESGYQPFHAHEVVACRVHAVQRTSEVRGRLEQALGFLARESAALPYGIDVAYARVASSAGECGEGEVAARAAALHVEYRQRRLVSI